MLATCAYVLAGRLETVKFLANTEGVDLNAQSKASCSSDIILHACIMNNTNHMFGLCMQKGETALIYAVMEKRLDEARILVKAGADVDIQEYVSYTMNTWSRC